MRHPSAPPPSKPVTMWTGEQRMVPGGVAKAIRWMRDNLTTRPNVEEIATVAGTPARTLRRQFRRFTGYSPIAFHRNLRLEAARRALRADKTDTDVTTVAVGFGFSHFGHFAARYRQRFGELPSGTLRAGREPLTSPPRAAQALVTLAVLPFVSGETNAGEEEFAGSTTEGVISALGRMRWLDVLGPAMPTFHQPGFQQRLGAPSEARYAIRGRVGSLGNRVQVIVRLFEISTARHIWGDAFEGEPNDLLALQKRLIEAVAGTLPMHLRDEEARRVERKPALDRTIHDLTMRAFRAASTLTREMNTRALEDLDRALSIDPEFALATALSSWCHAQQAIYNFAGGLDAERREARRFTALTLDLSDGDSLVFAILGTASALVGDLDLAERLIEKSLAIDPYCPMAWQRRGWIATYRGGTTALADFNRCLTLNPHDPGKFNSLLGISAAHFLAGHYDLASDWAVQGILERPSAIWAHRISAAAQARCGRTTEARRGVGLLLRHYPDLNVPTVINALPNQAEFLDRFAEGLESAGLPITG